jgi:hypothetical protein
MNLKYSMFKHLSNNTITIINSKRQRPKLPNPS